MTSPLVQESLVRLCRVGRAGLIASILALGWLPSAWGQPSDTPLPYFWRPDGPVHALLVTNGITYFGGAFTYVGPDSGSAGVIDLATTQAKRGFPKIEGTVLAAVPDGLGGWFLGGAFTNVGSLVRSNLVRVLADNTIDPQWKPHLNGTCRAMLSWSGQLYLGGGFTRVAGVTRNRLAAVDPVTGQVGAWNPNAGGVVNAMVLDGSGSLVYVGGAFTTVGGSTRTRIAALNLGTGLATAWDPAANQVVNTIAVAANTVYAGGNFTTIGTRPRNRIAALDATAANGLASDWNPNIAGGAVSNLVIGSGVIYAGGAFTSVGGLARSNLVAIDLVTGLPTAWNPSPDTNVNALLLTGESLYVGGAFTNIGGAARRYVAVLELTNGTALPWAPAGSGLDLIVQPTVEVMSAGPANQMLIGGTFASIGGALRNNLAAVDNSTGEVTAWNPDASGTVSALAFAPNTVYAGGSFTNIGGQPRNCLAALSDTTAEALAWNPNVRGRSGVAVLALAMSTNVLYAGGINITNVGGLGRTNLFAVTLSDGQPVSWHPATLRTTSAGSVNALVRDGDTIFVGGDFTSCGGQSRTNLAAVSPAGTGTVQSWSPNPNNVVLAVAVSSNTVYAGGTFTSIGSVLRNRLAAVDRTTGFGILTWNPDASGGSSPRVSALAMGSTCLYAGGQFTINGGEFRTNAAALRLSNGQAGAWQPSPGALVRAMVVGQNAIFVGGDFTAVGGKAHTYFAVFAAGPEIVPGTPAVTTGKFGFQIRSGEGSQVVVERSTDLASWAPISTNAVTGSRIPFSDPEPVGLDARFYRVGLSLTP